MAKNGDIMLKNITESILAIFQGLLTVTKHLFRKPVTEEYPETRPKLNHRFRGGHILNKCLGCGFCVQVCPTNAISITKDENSQIKYLIDMGKCIFCGNCEYYCPIKSMKMTPAFEFATTQKSNLIIEIKNSKA